MRRRRSRSQKVTALPHSSRDRAHQPDLLEKRCQRGESGDLHLVPVRAPASGTACFARVQADTAVWHRIAEQIPEEVASESVDIGHEHPGDPPHVRRTLPHTITGELDVAGFPGGEFTLLTSNQVWVAIVVSRVPRYAEGGVHAAQGGARSPRFPA